MSEVLFEVTKDNLETGLRGYPVGYCTTSHVDPQKGLFYVGRPIAELASMKPEDVIELLLGEKISFHQACSADLEKQISLLPRSGHPMKLFCAALLLMGMLEGKNNYRTDVHDCIAKIPHLTAIVINHHAGWGKTPAPSKDLSYMDNFAQMVKFPGSHTQEWKDAARLFNVLHYDHGGGNLSTFVGKAVASGLEDTYGSLTSAMCALAGPRHGKANQDCLEFMHKLQKEVGSSLTETTVEEIFRNKLAKNELIFGFGHAVLRVEDARATVLYDYAEKHFSSNALVKLALLVRKVGPKVLKENPKIADPYPNVDAISGTVLSAAGFTYPEYYTLLFGMARIVGIGAQILYERLEARGGKGTPIVRPKYLYKDRNSAV